PRGIERPGLEDLDRPQVAGAEGGIHGGGEPDEAAARPLAERQAQLEFRRRLVDLVHHQRVPRRDEAVLEPAARDPGRHDHDVPRRRLGRGFALTVHDADLERRLQNGPRDRPDGERLAGTRPRNDAESRPRRRQAADVVPVLPREQGVDVEAHRQLDRFASRARRGDHHDPAGGGLRGAEGVGIGGKEVVSGDSHGRNIDWRSRGERLCARRKENGRRACAPPVSRPYLPTSVIVTVVIVVIGVMMPTMPGHVTAPRHEHGGPVPVDVRPSNDHDASHVRPRYAETNRDADARLPRHGRGTEHLPGSRLSSAPATDQREGGGVGCRISPTTSPGSAWRPWAFLEKMRRPSTSTSKTPPDDWISFTSAWG